MNSILAAVVQPELKPLEVLLGLGGGIVALIVFGFLIVNAVLWSILPFLLLSRLNQIITRLKSIESEVEDVNRNTRSLRKQGERPNEKQGGDSSLNYHFGR